MIDRALEQLAAGRVVAIATESFFGLLADVQLAEAIDCLMSLKPRGADKGVPVLLPSSLSWLELVTAIPPEAQRLADEFWPGPLSIALPARPEVDPRVALEGSVAVRVPSPSPALSLARAWGRSLTATSANLPGLPPATNHGQVAAVFASAIADGRLLVVPGESPGGRPSTIVVFDGAGAHVAREGAIPSADVMAALARA